jgi:FSR family fosmidomycin resistance protein-like MFS transporter
MNTEPEAPAEPLPVNARCCAAAAVTVASGSAAWGWIALLGFGHLAVDCACSFALTRTLDATDLAAGAVFAYNAVAFWGQPFLGWTADHRRCSRALAVGGLLLLAAGALPLGVAPWLTIALLGAGNACYHVGGGVQAIRLSRGCLGGLGLFVGPGAFGLMLGVGLARMDFVATPWVFAAVLAALAGVLWRFGRRSLLQDDPLGMSLNQAVSQCQTVRAEAAHYAQAADGAVADVSEKRPCRRIVLAVALVLACIAIRAFVGTGFAFEWNGSAATVLALAVALAAGKIAGGLCADRFGWLRATIVVLVLSVPALWFGRESMAAGLAGAALFQAPMAVTLGALVWALPRRPGLAFGLASAFVYAGGFPQLAGQVPWLHTFVGLSCLSGAAVLMLAWGCGGRHAIDRSAISPIRQMDDGSMKRESR